MSSKSRFHVSASSELSLPPEFARLRLEINAVDAIRHVSYDAAVTAHNRLFQTIEANPLGIKVNASLPITSSYSEWIRDESQLRYKTSSAIGVTFTDFVALGELVASLTHEDLVSLSVKWHLTKETEAATATELRRTVLSNARKVAADYASSEGISADELVLVSMTDLESVQPAQFREVTFMGAVNDSPVASVEPELIQIKSSIQAIFKG